MLEKESSVRLLKTSSGKFSSNNTEIAVEEKKAQKLTVGNVINVGLSIVDEKKEKSNLINNSEFDFGNQQKHTQNSSEKIDCASSGCGSCDEERGLHNHDVAPITPVNASFNSSQVEYNNLRPQNEESEVRSIAAQISRNWAKPEFVSESLERRLRDFRFAQGKRRQRYGTEKPWGIIGLYDHLSAIRIDVEWAEDAAWRRENKYPYLSWADFDKSKDAGFNKPFFTYSLLVICTITLMASLAKNGWKVEPLSVNPMIGPSAQTLLDLGAKLASLIIDDKEWYRLLTPMFLHAGIVHYVVNMLALWFIGGAVERCHGSVAAFTLFIIPAVGGTILSAIFLPEYISVGASGGIFGLVGACIADIILNWSLLFSKDINSEDSSTPGRHVKVLIWLVLDIVVNCFLGLTPFVDNFNHLGGMFYGVLCGFSTLERLPQGFFGVHKDVSGTLREYFVRFSGLILSAITIFSTMLVLMNSDGIRSPCSSCRYLSCVPFPPWREQYDKWWYCDNCGTVTADATRDKDTGFFNEVQMICPDGNSMKYIDVSVEAIDATDKLAKNLPSYCRLHCDDISW